MPGRGSDSRRRRTCSSAWRRSNVVESSVPWCPAAAWLGCRGSRDGGLDLRAPRPGSVPALSPGPAGSAQ
jgi:hypothetical protein